MKQSELLRKISDLARGINLKQSWQKGVGLVLYPGNVSDFHNWQTCISANCNFVNISNFKSNESKTVQYLIVKDSSDIQAGIALSLNSKSPVLLFGLSEVFDNEKNALCFADGVLRIKKEEL